MLTIALMTCVAVSFPSSSQAAPITCDEASIFGPAVYYPAPVYPSDVALGDLDGDGILDAAVTEKGSNSIRIFRGLEGDPNGRIFGPGAALGTLPAPQRIASGDFNSDGNLDLVVTSPDPNEGGYALYFGRGNGEFTVTWQHDAYFDPWGVVSADFNADGILDLAITNSIPSGLIHRGGVRILLGNGSDGHGDGTFRRSLDYGTRLSLANAIVKTDLNGDGATDLVFCNGPWINSVTVLLAYTPNGIPDGTFTPFDLPTAGEPTGVATGDFNGDQIVDLAIGNLTGRSVTVYMGRGGRLETEMFSGPTNYPVQVGLFDLVTADFNQDGILDLAASTAQHSNVVMLLGNGSRGVGDGTFTRTRALHGIPGFGQRLVEGDLDGDRVPDLLVANVSASDGQDALVLLPGACPPANRPPNCDAAVASPDALWPVDDRFVAVTVQGVTDPDGDSLSIRVTAVTQDEPVGVSTCPDATIGEDGSVRLRAERSGSGDGRVYQVAFVAEDGRGGSCNGTVAVCVPRDRRPDRVCTDSGQITGSLGPCRTGEGDEPLHLQPLPLPRGSVSLQYQLPRAGQVSVTLYDVAGRRVALLVDTWKSQGTYREVWVPPAAGVYFARLRLGVQSTSSVVVVGP